MTPDPQRRRGSARRNLPDPLPVPVRAADGRWNLARATELQIRLRERVERRDRLGPVRLVAGADVSYTRGDGALYAAVVVLDARRLEPVETVSARHDAVFPYLPGYLSFREAPAVMEAFASLGCRPDLLLVDGQGVAHPRRFGLACHLGLLLDLPTIGVAKSILVGEARQPGLRRGSRTALVHRGERVGTALRTRDGVKPVYVSIGHRVSLGTAARLVLRSTRRYRIPEPTRRAHHAVNEMRAGARRRPARRSA